jgi:hypothetical protein
VTEYSFGDGVVTHEVFAAFPTRARQRHRGGDVTAPVDHETVRRVDLSEFQHGVPVRELPEPGGVDHRDATSFTEPFNLARYYASADHLSGGRTGWNIVTSFVGAENFGRVLPDHDERYRQADEFTEVVTLLPGCGIRGMTTLSSTTRPAAAGHGPAASSELI